MNRPAVQKLRDYLASIPEDQFSYEDYWTPAGPFLSWLDGEVPECGTPGCVAGHCVTLFKLTSPRKASGIQTVTDVAAEYLGLTSLDAEVLFHLESYRANLSDAIARLDWLLEHESLEDYRCDKESWFIADHRCLQTHDLPEAEVSEETQPQILPVPTHHMGVSTERCCADLESHPLHEQLRESLVSENESLQPVVQK